MKQSSVGRRVFAFLMGMIFVGAGLYMISRGVSDVTGALHSNSWASARGTIVASRVVTISSSRGGSGYRPTASFRYRVGHADHRSGRIRFGDAPEAQSSQYADDWVARHPVGSAVTIYYDPRNPSEAVLERGLRISALLLPMMGSFFLLLGLIPVGLAIVGLPGDRPRADAAADSPPGVEIVSHDGRQIVFRQRPRPLAGLLVAAFGLALGVISLAVGLSTWPDIQTGPMTLPLTLSVLILWLAYRVGAVRETLIDAPTRSLTITLTVRGWSRSTRYPLDRYGVVRCETVIGKGSGPDGSARGISTTHLVELRAPDVAPAPGRLPGPGPRQLLIADTPDQAREITRLVGELLGLKQVDAGVRVLGGPTK